MVEMRFSVAFELCTRMPRKLESDDLGTFDQDKDRLRSEISLIVGERIRSFPN